MKSCPDHTNVSILSGNRSDVLPLHKCIYMSSKRPVGSRGETSLPERRTMDTVTNASGHTLLTLFLSSDVRVINGRMNDIVE